MQSAQEIYLQAVSSLSAEERLKLATLILQGLAATDSKSAAHLSTVELIKSFQPGRGCQTSAEADEYLRRERDSWER